DSEGKPGLKRAVCPKEGIGAGHTEDDEQARLAELQAIDHRQPAEGCGQVDDSLTPRPGGGQVPGPGQRDQEQEAPDPVAGGTRERRERPREPGDRRWADEARELGDLNSRAKSIELGLLDGKVVDRGPSARGADARSRQVEGEVVVEVV